MDKDNKLLSGAEDLYGLCEKRGCAVFSRFYDEAEQTFIADSGLLREGGFFFGGHAECERKILGVFPEWEDPDFESFPLRLLKISLGYKKTLSHRDYLGSLMGLGIERDRIGDILVYDDSAVVFVHESVAGYVKGSLVKIGSVGVSVCFGELTGFEYPPHRFEELETVAASLRLDAVLAAALGLSRSEASALTERERVSVNHRIQTDSSKKVCEGDLLSVRGFGRYVIGEVGGHTRKGRIHLTVKKYL